MIELINGIHHYPLTTFSAEGEVVVARDLYPHKVQTRVVVQYDGDPERAQQFAAHLNRAYSLGGNPLIA